MTAPAGISEITARISSLQGELTSLSAPALRATASTVGSSSAAAFAAALATQTGAGATATDATDATSSAGGGSAVVADAKKYLGVPYVWGGESRSGIDCSGLVQRTFSDLGVHLPRTADEQSHTGTAVPSLADAQPGDLLFFGSPAYHVAIYAGDNQLIESPEPGKTVHVTDVYQTPTSIRRVSVPGSTDAAVSPLGGLSAGALSAAGLNPAVARFAADFAAAEQAHQLPPGLLAAVAQQESGGNPQAVSSAGAQGLMQLMPSTAAGMGVNPFDPQQAIDAAAKILHRNLTHYHGSVGLALAAYNAGSGAVDQYGGIPPFTETQNYVKSITAMLAAGG